MSLHAQPSPEARERLDTQRRNSTVSSVVIALLSLSLLGLVLGYSFIERVFMDPDQPEARWEGPRNDDGIKPDKVRPSVARKPSAPAATRTPVVVSITEANVTLPVADTPVEIPAPDYGNGEDFGHGWDTGPGLGGDGPQGLPEVFDKRCSKAERAARLRETGGTDACEEAVTKALRWLKATQSGEGSWPGSSANTGFALLAYLGHCETPLSVEYGDSCTRAIVYLTNLGLKNPAGWLSASPNPAANKQLCYEHAINTYALAEAVTFCRSLRKEGMVGIPDLEEVARKAGQLIIDNQTKQGGWEYGYAETSARGGGDLSITAWQLQALKACKHTGMDFRNLAPCVRRGLEFVESLAGADGGFGYTAPGKGDAGYLTLTGAGVLCQQIWDRPSRSAVRDGARYVDRNTRFGYNTRFADLYGHYYEAQAMLNRGGEQWQRHNRRFRDELIRNQNADGSWKAPGGGKELRAVAASYVRDATYRTCLCTLMLEVYYRFLPSSER